MSSSEIPNNSNFKKTDLNRLEKVAASLRNAGMIRASLTICEIADGQHNLKGYNSPETIEEHRINELLEASRL